MENLLLAAMRLQNYRSRQTILLMERSILNILGYLGGISTEANKWARIAPKQVACTRKTVWGLLDKWAFISVED